MEVLCDYCLLACCGTEYSEGHELPGFFTIVQVDSVRLDPSSVTLVWQATCKDGVEITWDAHRNLSFCHPTLFDRLALDLQRYILPTYLSPPR